jgi:biopolymer transport protein ExbD
MLKRQHQMMASFSMASMTDVIFLLLIFFMVTSTFVFPTGLEVSLPESTQQSAVKPTTKVFIDAEQNIYATAGEDAPQPLKIDALVTFLQLAQQQDSTGFIALYADETVPYGKIVEVLNVGASHNLKMVLATKAVSSTADLTPATTTTPDATVETTTAGADATLTPSTPATTKK